MLNITNLDISTYLKRDFNDNEKEVADNLISQIEDKLKFECNRDFDYTKTFTQYFDSPENVFYTDNFPVASIECVYVNNVEQDLTENEDYFIYDDRIEFQNSLVTTSTIRKAIKLEYKITKFWGEELRLFVIKWIAYEFLNSENAGMGLSSMDFSEVRQEFDTTTFNKEKEAFLAKYRVLNI